jgi:diguanylate cyclase (GGDEF)-like protein
MVAMAKLVESRDQETGAHLDRVQAYVRVLATGMSVTEKYRSVIDDDYIRLIQQTSTLHDIGKVAIPDAILLKPGKLDQRERAIMQTHAMLGANTLDAALQRFPNAKYLHMARTIAATHHEKFDGTGYPARLAGAAIPLCGRIVAVADVYDALTTQRPYKPAMTHDQARSIIFKDSGTHFDPDVIAAFLASEAEFRLISTSADRSEEPVVVPQLPGDAPLNLLAGENDQPGILVVEDDPMQRQMLLDLFRENGCRVEAVQSPHEALKLIETMRPRIVISDWSMPEMNGTELCRRVRNLDRGQYIFFLIVTVHGEKAQMISAFDAGVDDFVIKPYHQGELLARVRAGMRTIRLHDEVNAQNQATMQLNTQLVRLNSRLEKLATTDELTGLANRRQGLAKLEEKSALAERYGDSLSVAMLDLDHFKAVNDTHGHDAGNEVLRSVAATLQASVRATDTVCRVGGEEFLIVFPAQTVEEAGISAERCRAAVEQHLVHAEHAEIPVTISVGLASRRVGQHGAATLMRDADAALYAAKHAGRNCVRYSVRTSATPLPLDDRNAKLVEQ